MSIRVELSKADRLGFWLGSYRDVLCMMEDQPPLCTSVAPAQSLSNPCPSAAQTLLLSLSSQKAHVGHSWSMWHWYAAGAVQQLSLSERCRADTLSRNRLAIFFLNFFKMLVPWSAPLELWRSLVLCATCCVTANIIIQPRWWHLTGRWGSFILIK